MPGAPSPPSQLSIDPKPPAQYDSPMNRAPSFCGIILAAGASSRMGRDKALLPWPPRSLAAPARSYTSVLGRPLPSATPLDQTFLGAAISLLNAFADMVIVIAGGNSAELTPVVDARGQFLVPNPHPERGQFSSLQVGMQEVLNRGRDAAIITLVDRPPVKPATLRLLRDAFCDAAEREKWAVVPEFEGKHGHPIVVGREMITKFLTAPPTATARDIEHAHEQRIEYVPVEDPFVTLNVDSPEDYEKLCNDFDLSAAARADRR